MEGVGGGGARGEGRWWGRGGDERGWGIGVGGRRERCMGWGGEGMWCWRGPLRNGEEGWLNDREGV